MGFLKSVPGYVFGAGESIHTFFMNILLGFENRIFSSGGGGGGGSRDRAKNDQILKNFEVGIFHSFKSLGILGYKQSPNKIF